MKIVLITMFFVCSIMTIASAGVMSVEQFMRTLNRIQGTWYDLDGNPAFTFDGSNFNGYKIEGFYDPAGGGSDFGTRMRVINNGRPADIWMNFTGLGKDQTKYHQYITINHKVYRRTQQPRYYESVGGIYLGMPLHSVIALYGSPDVQQNNRIGYSKIGLTLIVRNGMVEQIEMYTFGDRRLDRSGLGASDSLQEFAEAYGMDKLPTYSMKSMIGYSEFLWFSDYPRMVKLSIYAT